MDFEPLNRTKEDYAWAMEEALKCPDLTPFQQDIFLNLLRAALVSVEAFDEMRRVYMTMTPGDLFEAIQKCRARGIGKEWPEHAHQT